MTAQSSRSQRTASAAGYMAASTIAIGVVSYLVLAVGSRTIAEDEMAVFVSFWALLNMMVLSMVLPIEHIAPRLLADRSDLKSMARRITLHSVALSLVAALVAVGLSMLLTDRAPTVLHVAGIGFALSLGVWSGRRALLVGSGRFRSVMVRSAVIGIIGSLGLAVVWLLDVGWAALLFVPVIVANLVGALGTRWSSSGRAGADQFRSVAFPVGEYRVLATLVGATFVTLVLASGSLALADSWQVAPATVVAYAGLLSIVRIPHTLLNSVMAPVNLTFVQLSVDRDMAGLKTLAVRTTLLLLASVIVVTAGTAAIGPLALRILLGGEYRSSATFAAGVALAEGAVWLTVIPRLLSAALGASRVMAVSFSVGLVAFAVVAVSPMDGHLRLVMAPLIAGLAVVVVALPWCFKVMRREQIVSEDWTMAVGDA